MTKEKKGKGSFSHPRWEDPPAYEVVDQRELTSEEKKDAKKWREKLKAKGIQITD